MADRRSRGIVIVACAAWLGTVAPLRAGAQVETIATVAPVLSPVGLWRSSTSAEAGPGALAMTLSLRINSGASLGIPALLENAINNFPSPVSVTTSWDLTSGATVSTIDLAGYFSNPTSALVTTGASIASSQVEGRMTTGRATTFTPFSGNAVAGVGTPGATVHLMRQRVIRPINGIGSRTDNLDLRLNLSGVTGLSAGTYTGTLTLRAIAY